jgi:hypothetical protein
VNSYEVNFTDVNTSPIYVLEQAVDNTSIDISLFGLIRLSYGEELQENLLHLLENFSCPEDEILPNTPDLSISHNNLLENPIKGQFWHNSTNGTLYHYDGIYWIPIRGLEDVGANWGSIGHGQQLPRPVSPTTGYVFPYEECIWSVSPAAYDGSFQGMNCYTEVDSRVIMEYRLTGDTFPLPGIVNYLIIGIKGNNNLGHMIVPPPIEGITPTPTPTIGAITPTPSVTPTINVTPSNTPTVTPTKTVTPTPSPTQSSAPLGISTRLYTSPSPGDPGGVGPGGVETRLENTCGPLVTLSEVEKSYFISLQGLSGGTPPYTVSFRWIYINGPWGRLFLPNDGQQYALPNMTIKRSYSGGTIGGSSYERTNLIPGNIPNIKLQLKFDDPNLFTPTREYQIHYSIQGRIILWDSLGNSRTWWIPINPTPIGGSNITTDPGAILYHTLNWTHYYDCSNCPDCGL